ncbi:hypothetical protein BT69DRAFT_1301964 [Atractiella rhizophila]|nr:hypothetical protein BT69DRAFT_1301964 [Atractiella rhizophila]
MGIKEPKGAWKRVWINIKGRLLSILKDHKDQQVISNHQLPAKSFREASVSSLFYNHSLQFKKQYNQSSTQTSLHTTTVESELELASQFLVILIFADGSLLVLRAENEEDHKDLVRLLGSPLANPYREKGDDLGWRVQGSSISMTSETTNVFGL